LYNTNLTELEKYQKEWNSFLRIVFLVSILIVGILFLKYVSADLDGDIIIIDPPIVIVPVVDYDLNWGGYIRTFDNQIIDRTTRITFLKPYFYYDWLETGEIYDYCVARDSYLTDYLTNFNVSIITGDITDE